MVSTAQRLTGDADEAEDIVQDVLLRLWQMRDQLRLPMDSIATVLTRNIAIDWLRRRRPHAQIEQAVLCVDEAATDERIERVMKLIDKLPDMQQTIIRLRHMEGMEMRDIAALTGTTEVAVRKTLSRARQRLLQEYTKMKGNE